MRILFAVLICGFLFTGAFAQTEAPRFEDCAVSSTFSGKAANFLVPAARKKDFPNIFRPFSNFFKRIFRQREEGECCRNCNCYAVINDVVLSRTEVVAGCPTRLSGSSCPYDTQSIIVWTSAYDPNNKPLRYNYEVSAGKITGEGTTVVWDLSGVKAGTYRIMVRIDSGAGFINSQPTTREIEIVECESCKHT